MALELEYQRLEELLGEKITPSHYELLSGMTGGTYMEKTHHELINDEKLFLLRNEDEEKQFMENDFIV